MVRSVVVVLLRAVGRPPSFAGRRIGLVPIVQVVESRSASDSCRMNETRHPNDFLPLTIEQTRDLATAVREDFGGMLSRAEFIESLLLLLDDVPGFEAGEADAGLIESAWAIYSGRPSEL